MLRKDAGLLQDDLQDRSKFLARHRYPPVSQICFCCSDLLEDEAQAVLEQSTTFPTSKISIKQIINRNRSIQGIVADNYNKNRGNRSFQENRTYLSDSNRNQHKKIDYSKQFRTLARGANQLPAHVTNKIKFSYDTKAKKVSSVISSRTGKEQTDRQMANRQAIRIQNQKASENQINTMNRLQKQFNEVLDSKKGDSSEYYENDSRQSQKAKQNQIMPERKVKETVKTDHESGMANFSFGHRQKTQFMSSYMKQIVSKPPQTIKELKQSLLELESKYLSNDSLTNRKQAREEQKQIEFMRGTFNRRGMMNFIHRIETVSQDVAVSESDQSVVIDDFRSIMDDLKRKKRREFEGTQKLGSVERYF